MADVRDMEVPIASESAHSAESGGAMKELLDRPYIDRHVGLDFFVMIIMGVVLGLLSIPYCAGVEDIPKLWLKAFGPAGFIDADLEISGHLGVGQGAPVWILLCWGFCTAVGILKAVMKLDKYPSFIDELKHQHVDPMVNLKVVICCIASLGAGAVMGLEAGLGSVGAAFGFLLWKGVEKVLPSTNETAADQRRRAYILAGLAGAFGTIFPAPVVSVILVSEIATAGTERHTPEGEFMAGRRLPKKVIFYLVPVAVSAFVMRWAETKHQTIHSYYGYGYDNLSVFLGVGLGIIAAVAVTFFLIVGAIIKAIFTMLGAPLERRLGLAARQAGGA
ncbi:40S ribosomal protein S15 [Durusdinium trenchii]|uniref:40S ribosomal protein S15 n=1 Tax=Durusdinium trenchii TaxID=1381693 RepID=A0ABP0M706_9DINO